MEMGIQIWKARAEWKQERGVATERGDVQAAEKKRPKKTRAG